MSQQNRIQSMSADVRERAEKIIATLELNDFFVAYSSATKSLKFKKKFKEMTIPLLLVDREQWADIRQIYQAVFRSGPQVENFGAQNEWSRWTTK